MQSRRVPVSTTPPGTLSLDSRHGGRSGGGLQLRDRQPLVRSRLRPARPGRRRARRAALVLSRGAGADPDPPRRRAHPRVHRLPRAAQRRPRALQGRHPLPPGRRPRRGARARGADDVEDGGRQHAVRRRQGRRERARRAALARRAAARHALVHRQDPERDRAQPRHPGARRQHQRPGDGVDHGPVRQAPRAHAGGASPASRSSSTAPTGARRRPAAASSTCSARRRPALGLAPASTRVVVQGFGNVGSWAARIMPSSGARSSASRTPTARSARTRGSTRRRCTRTCARAGSCAEFDGRGGDRGEELLRPSARC